MSDRLKCFKAYDIRGKVPTDLNKDIAYRLGRAYVAEIAPTGPVAVGRDIRLTSSDLAGAVMRGINEAGADVVDIGLCGTEMVYFAAARPGMGGGIMVTASHNPMEYNGMKLVRDGAIPVSGDSGLDDLERRVRECDLGGPAAAPGTTSSEDVLDAYVAKLLSFVDVTKFKPLKIVANSGNGGAGPIVDALAKHLPFEITRLYHEPDGTFPNGIPNPLLEENQPPTANAVREHGANLGLAWDGDFDRCFFFDETGTFVDGYYIVGLLATHMLRTQGKPGDRIIHDPRMVWNTVRMVEEAGGVPVQSKTGHAFIKEKMRAVDALYGGEMSAHHYFRDFAYCDSGMIPWLVVTTLMCKAGRPLSELVADCQAKHPGSGEINSKVADPDAAIAEVRGRYLSDVTQLETVDGLSMEFDGKWRFNLRKSQTEPILRLNVESVLDEPLMRRMTDEILASIRG